MSHALTGLPDDGTPSSSRLHDRSDTPQGLAQARSTFLAGCGLPAAWAGQPQWHVLETRFGLGLNFLATWAAWRADPQRPERLFYTACEAGPVATTDRLRALAQEAADLAPQAGQLAAQWWGLLPGMHRLTFDDGRVQLTLLIGADVQTLLRQQQPQADSVYLDDAAPGHNPGHAPALWNAHTLKALARSCRRGARLASGYTAPSVREALAQCGFHVQPGAHEGVQARYDPPWQPRRSAPPLPETPLPAGRRALVLGAGLGGACVAAALATRGWQITVLDAHAAPAHGASGIPAGVFAPHVSPDDSLLSRLSRAGVRTTLALLAQHLGATHGSDWDDGGVLEHGVEAPPRLAWSDGPGCDWSRPATPEQLQGAGLPENAPSCWHARGGWVRPRALIEHLLALPGISWHGNAPVARLDRSPDGLWHAHDAQGAVRAEADLAVVCAGPGSNALLGWQLQPLRGLMSFGPTPAGAALPPHPINGHGNFMPGIVLEGTGARGWAVGSTFERDQDRLPLTPDEIQAAHQANHERLQALAPASAAQLAGAADGWAGVRCAAANHLPLVGPVDAAQHPGLWACTALGARGLTLAPLCAQLLAARLHGEPLPLDLALARALATERLYG